MAYKVDDLYWDFIRSEKILRRAAHLVEKDSRSDFHDSLVERQVFSHSRNQIIREISQSLDAGRYMPGPISPVAIPKSPFSQRPGAILPYRDRVVMMAIVAVLAPVLDAQLSKNVWSWRVLPQLRGKSPDSFSRRGVFSETDISEFPFLKRKTVRKYIDSFEPWYALWPQFEEQTFDVLRDESYTHVVFSDISAYFENIQLHPITRHFEQS